MVAQAQSSLGFIDEISIHLKKIYQRKSKFLGKFFKLCMNHGSDLANSIWIIPPEDQEQLPFILNYRQLSNYNPTHSESHWFMYRSSQLSWQKQAKLWPHQKKTARWWWWRKIVQDFKAKSCSSEKRNDKKPISSSQKAARKWNRKNPRKLMVLTT